MMWLAKMQRGVLLRLYLLLSHLVPLFAGTVLRKRLKRGKEHPTRWTEKQAHGLASRPKGRLVWLNAVGLGEVLSLRGLIDRLSVLLPDASFLVTSTTAASAAVFAKQLPPRTIHQFLPLDAPAYRQRFLDHFRPDLCLWVEQDLWPGFVVANAQRNIPQAAIAGRMDAGALRSRKKAKSLFADLYRVMLLVTAQDARSAENLSELGAQPAITRSLKPAAPALDHDPATLLALQKALQGRTIWAVAPSHAEDEKIALAAHAQLRQSDPTALLIIAPRFPDRCNAIAEMIGATVPLRSVGQQPTSKDHIWLFDTFGELGLVYRLARAALIGGTFSDIEGHNPWEAATLGSAVLHGPRTANFANDFAELDGAKAATQVETATQLATALTQANHEEIAANARQVIADASQATDRLAQNIARLLDPA